MEILMVKDGDTWKSIPAIKGEKGDMDVDIYDPAGKKKQVAFSDSFSASVDEEILTLSWV